MNPRRHRPPAVRLLTNVTFLGTAVLILSAIGLYVAYNANRGLPLVAHYKIKADVPDAAQLTAGVSEVRIGGARVGLVTKVRPMPGSGTRKPYAQLSLTLDKRLDPLPADTVVRVRPRSILGAKYLDITPGHARASIPAGGVLALRHARPAFEFDDAFRAFDDQTRQGIRRTLAGLGDGLAGRGGDLNDTLAAVRHLLPPVQRVTTALAAPSTNLAGLIDGMSSTVGALAPVAPTLGRLVDTSTTTLAALDASGDDLGRTIDGLAPTERAAARTLADARPVLGDAAALAHGLRTATPLLPSTSARLARALDAGTPLLTALHREEIAERLGGALDAVAGLAADPARRPAVSSLTTTVQSLKTALGVLLPAQRTCKVATNFVRNVGEAYNAGDPSGTWLTALLIVDADGTENLTGESATPSPHLHSNPSPIENDQECEAGNEPYRPGRAIGNVEGRQAP